MNKYFRFFAIIVIFLTACGTRAPASVSLPTPLALNVLQVATPCPVCPPCPTQEIRVVTATFSTLLSAPAASPTPLATTLVTTVSPTMAPRPYTVQSNSPVYMQNFSNPSQGCSWIGVGGQVFDSSGKPVTRLVVMVDGEQNGKRVELLSLTGLAPAYGSGGYEIKLGNQLFDSTNTLKITLYDAQGNPLSQPFPFKTFNDCQRGQIIINFIARAGS